MDKDIEIKNLNEKLKEQEVIMSQIKEYLFVLENDNITKDKKIKSLTTTNNVNKLKPVKTSNSMKEKLSEKLLNKSNSYIYYKNSHKSLVNQNKTNKQKIKSLKKDIQLNNVEEEFLKKELRNKNRLINFLKTEINNKNKDLLNFENKCMEFENKLDKFEHLINLYETRIGKFHEMGFKKDIKDLNIAYVLNAFPVTSETFIVSEIKWLKDNGFNIILFTKKDPINSSNIDFHVKNIRFNDEIELETLLVEYGIDLIHTHFVYPICTNFTYPVAEKLAIPFTVFAHAYDIFTKENDQINKIDEISNSKYCKAIFTLSNFHKNYLLARGVDEEKIIITKQAVSYEIVPIKEKDHKIKKIVSVSRFVEKKGLDVLIDSAKLLENENYEFHIYGYGPLEEKLKDQIIKLDCNNISVEGALDPNEVKNVLMDADLVVSPCKIAKNGDMDGFPTVIFESMAVGTPILTTSVSAIPEIVKDEINGFITVPDNPKIFAEKIRDIHNLSTKELFEICKNAQKDVINISSVEKTMNTYVKIFEGD